MAQGAISRATWRLQEVRTPSLDWPGPSRLPRDPTASRSRRSSATHCEGGDRISGVSMFGSFRPTCDRDGKVQV